MHLNVLIAGSTSIVIIRLVTSGAITMKNHCGFYLCIRFDPKNKRTLK